MRIVGTLPHPNLKITIFQQGERFAVKFERGGVEQTYKFSTEEGAANLQQLKNMVSEAFVEHVSTTLREMQKTRADIIRQNLPDNIYDEFEEII